MKIKTIKIFPNGGRFSIEVRKESEDKYIEEERLPSAMGIYHYDPSKYSEKDAALCLVDCMISRHEKEILDLEKSKAELEILKEEIRHK